MVSRFSTLLIIFVVTSVCSVFSQSEQINTATLSRFRLQGGYVTSLINKDDLSKIFINCGYRTSDFDRFSSSVELGGAFEAGINSLLQSNYLPLIPIPYVKAGPELRLYNNLFVSANAGITGFLFFNSFAFAFFGGINTFYLIPIQENHFLEVEIGFHRAVLYENASLAYFGLGISLP